MKNIFTEPNHFNAFILACNRNMSISRDSSEAKKFLFSHLRRNDVKEIACQRILLGEDVVFISFEGDAKHVDDERTGWQVKRDAVLAKETLQLSGFLPQEFQGHFCAWREGRDVEVNTAYLWKHSWLFHRWQKGLVARSECAFFKCRTETVSRWSINVGSNLQRAFLD